MSKYDHDDDRVDPARVKKEENERYARFEDGLKYFVALHLRDQPLTRELVSEMDHHFNPYWFFGKKVCDCEAIQKWDRIERAFDRAGKFDRSANDTRLAQLAELTYKHMLQWEDFLHSMYDIYQQKLADMKAEYEKTASQSTKDMKKFFESNQSAEERAKHDFYSVYRPAR